MSAPWAVAVVALALLVLALTAVLARLLTVVTSLDRTLARLQEQVRYLRLDSPSSDSVAAVAPATALVSLDPGCSSCRDLALDLQASGQPEVPGVVLRVLGEDSAAVRALVGGLDVELVQPDAGGAAALLPHVLLAAGDGRVLAKGDPSSVAELKRLLTEVA